MKAPNLPNPEPCPGGMPIQADGRYDWPNPKGERTFRTPEGRVGAAVREKSEEGKIYDSAPSGDQCFIQEWANSGKGGTVSGGCLRSDCRRLCNIKIE